jgi:hypothetical protein
LAYYGILQPEDAQCFQSNVGLEPTFYILFVAALVLCLTTSFVVKAVKHYFRDLDPFQTALTGMDRVKDVELATQNPNETQAIDDIVDDIQPVPVLFTDQYRWLLRRESVVRPLSSEQTPTNTCVESRESLDFDIGSTAATLFKNESKPIVGVETRGQAVAVYDGDDENDVYFVNSGQILNLSSGKTQVNQAAGNLVAVKSLGTGFGAAALGTVVTRRVYDVDDEDLIFQSMSEGMPGSDVGNKICLTGDGLTTAESTSIDVDCPLLKESIPADDDAKKELRNDPIVSAEDESSLVDEGNPIEIPANSAFRRDDADIDSLKAETKDDANLVGAMTSVPPVSSFNATLVDEPSLSSPRSVNSLEIDANSGESLIGSSTLTPLVTADNISSATDPVLSVPSSPSIELEPEQSSTCHDDEPEVRSPSNSSVISVHNPGASTSESPEYVSPKSGKTETSANQVDLSDTSAQAVSLKKQSNGMDQTSNFDDKDCYDATKHDDDLPRGDEADDLSMATTDNHSVGSDHTPRRTLQMN